MAYVSGSIISDDIDSDYGTTDAADQIYGLGGNDWITGGGGADLIFGGEGNDTASYIDSGVGVYASLVAGAVGLGGTAQGDRLDSIENLYGSWSDDTLVGNDGANMLIGDYGNDTLKGGGGADVLVGYDDNDTLRGGAGGDILDGGSGTDTADYSDSSAGVFISFYFSAVAIGGDAEGDQLFGIENLTGSAYHDDLWGGSDNNVLNGGGGSDSLKGFGGNDTLLGGDGNDSLQGNDGDDWLNGGTGGDTMEGGSNNDSYVVDSIMDVVFEAASAGTDSVYSGVTFGLPANLENLTLTGSAAASAIGNNLANTITGNSGANYIEGGDAGDTLIGFTGNDMFVFRPGQANGDAIVDFNGNGAAAGDVLVFSGYGPGATFTQIDAMNWQVNYNSGLSHDVISFLNLTSIDASDYVFM